MTPQNPRIPRAGRRRWIAVSMGSVMICTAVAVLLAAVFLGDIRRYTYTSALASPDEARRLKGLAYLVHYSDDAEVVRQAAEKLDRAEREPFDDVVRYLSKRGMWDSRFGPAWVRFLVERSGEVEPERRSLIAVELGKMLWLGKPHHDDPRIPPAITRLLADEDPNVRMNALSAAACLPEPRRTEAIKPRRDDANPLVAARAGRLLELIEDRQATPPVTVEIEKLEPALRHLAELESKANASESIPLTDDMPEMIRVQAVRVSTDSTPDDLLPVFDSPQPSMRDLACVVALERFEPAECRVLAGKLIGSFNDHRRAAGVTLAAMTQGTAGDAELMRRLRHRADHPGSWIVEQHTRIALALLGEGPEGFDPRVLMQHRAFPKTTLVMALLHSGRLEGLDWLLNPFGEPGAGGVEELRLLLGYYRYSHVLARLMPPSSEMQDFPCWAGADVQRQAVEQLRDAYLVHRPSLRFNPAAKRFSVAETSQAVSE